MHYSWERIEELFTPKDKYIDNHYTAASQRFLRHRVDDRALFVTRSKSHEETKHLVTPIHSREIPEFTHKDASDALAIG